MFQIGDTVKVVKLHPEDAKRFMRYRETLGHEGVVVSCYGEKKFYVKFEEGVCWWYSASELEKVPQATTRYIGSDGVIVRLVDSTPVTVKPDGIRLDMRGGDADRAALQQVVDELTKALASPKLENLNVTIDRQLRKENGQPAKMAICIKVSYQGE